ncbi:hypothetical protein Pint_20915 [Pistacia integerrima]|uniref:Uncharacterized protein n=1 Tax=Pistacia integerrima TaxID=434235 RepID=A0ACC0X8D8_9ROSI|nr:hypothetical protein Pint_20915 [Pistacia integerrima]
MAVDTNFTGFLLEKVKLEDPWLPPRTWESIPSQSGTFLSSSSSQNHQLLADTSTVSEASLVRLALNALQGVQSSLVSIEKLTAAFSSDPADRSFHRIPSLWNRSSSTHALSKILKSIGCSGFLVFLLCEFVDYFRNSDESLMRKKPEKSELYEKKNDCDKEVKEKEQPRYSLVNQAFAVAVEKVLEGYICALDTLYASVGCLTSVVHSKITLLEVYLHTKELRTQIEALGNICNLLEIAICFSESSFEDLNAKAILEFHSFCRGGDLLTYLYTQLQVADPANRSLLKFLLLRSFEPYFGFIRSWIFKAEINDPFKEFMVEYVDNLPHDTHVKADSAIDFHLATFREQDGVSVPCFLKQFLIPLVRAGQQLQVLMKLLELCNSVFPGDHTYMDFLPCWSGFSSDHPFYASSITFNKGHIETMVIARNDYYKKMLEKLENLWTRLEFSYQQVVPCSNTPIFVGSGRSLETSVSFEMNDRMSVPFVADESGSNVTLADKDFDDTHTKDEFFYAGDTSGSSECSSLSDSEGLIESEQLTGRPNSLFGFEQKYFSALSFSMSTPMGNPLRKPLQSEKSCNVKRVSSEISKINGALGHFVLSQNKGMITSGTSEPPESGELNLSFRDVHYTDSQPNNCWPLGSLMKNPFCVEGGYRHPELHPLDSGLKVYNANMGVPKEALSCYNKLTGMNNASIEETLGEDQLGKGCATSNFALEEWKLNYNCNIFSINPMLTRNAFFHLPSKTAERFTTDPVQSLPFFDFSSVEDPCKVCLEKLAAGSSPEIFENSSVSAVSVERDQHSQQQYAVDEILTDKTKMSCAHPHLDSENHSKDVSGKNSFLAIFEIPLDFIIDKCLLQEIQLQYPFLYARYNYVSKLTIKLLEEGFDLHEHLLALRRYHFMELADWADLFIMSLWNHKWSVGESDHRVSEIQGFLESAVQRSSCERDHNKNRLFVYIKGDGTLPLSKYASGVHSFDFLGLGYQVDWPVSIVLTPRALKIYADIFSFLIQLKLAVFSLNDVWSSLKDLVHLINQNCSSTQHKREVGHFNILVKLR